MTTISDIRRTNVRAMAARLNSHTDFALRVEMSNSQVSQLIGENPVKNIGNKIARRFEAAFSRPEGWLDVARAPEEFNDIVQEPRISIVPTSMPELEKPAFIPFTISAEEIALINAYRRASDIGKLSIRAACDAADSRSGLVAGNEL